MASIRPATPYVPYERGLFLRSIQIKYTNRELMQSVLQNMQQLYDIQVILTY